MKFALYVTIFKLARTRMLRTALSLLPVLPNPYVAVEAGACDTAWSPSHTHPTVCMGFRPPAFGGGWARCERGSFFLIFVV